MVNVIRFLCGILLLSFFGCTASPEKVEEYERKVAAENVAYYKSREGCIDGVVYFMPTNGSSPLPKIGQDGLPVKCSK